MSGVKLLEQKLNGRFYSLKVLKVDVGLFLCIVFFLFEVKEFICKYVLINSKLHF